MDKLQEIKKLVQHGRDTFIGYVTHHEDKGHTEKAESNKEHAYNLQLALTIIDELIEEIPGSHYHNHQRKGVDRMQKLIICIITLSTLFLD